MTYDELKHFIESEMRMSQIYQPLMLMELIESGGISSRESIAKRLLEHDPSQVSYYENIVDRMPGKVLKGHSVVTKDRSSQTYHLTLTEQLSDRQKADLLALCHQRIESFWSSRKADPYSHRRVSSGYVSGSIRFDVLKRAKHRCELCGVSAKDKALEVDHIIPRSKGGEDTISNFQALCYSCNATKGNKDDTDFRAWGELFDHRDESCPFCNEITSRLVEQNELAMAFRDGYPVTEGHTLVIPKRHVADYFDLHQPELNAIQQLLKSQKQALMKSDPSIVAFNVGVNAGEAAGQTVFHCHIHLIPRRKGDMENPRGGVRGVIPAKQKY